MIKKTIFLLALLPLLTACPLMTRSDVKEHEQKRVMQDQVTTLQKSTADVNNRFAEVDSDLRGLFGRIEAVENQIQQQGQVSTTNDQVLNTKSQELDQKFKILQDEVVRLDATVASLKADLDLLKTSGVAKGGSDSTVSTAKKSSYEIAEDLFSKKDWMRAAQAYQKYRDDNPKGKNFSEATYKIGVCFQELGMNDEAKTFYDEAVAKFPDSTAAKKSRIRLKSLKK